MEKIYIVYKFTNTVTGDFYIGSQSIKIRRESHKRQPVWIVVPNDQVDQDMQKYGVDKFEFEILAEAEPEELKEVEQRFIEKLHPTYNSYNANGLDIERCKETKKEYMKEYNKTDKHKESQKKYNNQLCCYNGQTITLHALQERFRRQGIDHPTAEAKKYIIKESETPIEFYDVYP